MTPRECARLQSLDELKELPESPTQAFHALGNAVNSKVVEQVARALLNGVAPSYRFDIVSNQLDDIGVGAAA